MKSINSGGATMSLLFESTENIEFCLTPESNVIISTVPDKKEKDFFKISPAGHVTDSLKINARPEDIAFLKGFIIDKEMNRYYKWSFNSSKSPVEITGQNADFKWDTEKQRKQLVEIAEKSKAVCIDYKYNAPAPQKAVGEALQTTQVVTGH
ncbi:hypothetical protein AB6805_03150 [Chitinophaga sp. RCC_12]|uniref:hypothetical protein n=1 Tax=Chitinophaga sp. RCC_12 TaxID=3239226 RepID=UPI0035252A09